MTHNQVVASKFLSISLIVFTAMIFSSAGKYPQNITANQLSQIDAANDDELYMGLKLKYKDSISCKTDIHIIFVGNGEYNCNLYPYEIYLDKGILQIYKDKKLILTKFFLPK